MIDFLAALGLVFAIEGILFAAFPGAARRACAATALQPESGLRRAGIVAAIVGLVIIWLVRG